jgi:hypothetical protein
MAFASITIDLLLLGEHHLPAFSLAHQVSLPEVTSLKQWALAMSGFNAFNICLTDGSPFLSIHQEWLFPAVLPESKYLKSRTFRYELCYKWNF